MDETIQLLAVVFGGSFFGSFLGPLPLDEWRSRKRRKSWLKPRQRLVMEIFDDVEVPVISLSDLTCACGATKQETREVLVSIGARGTTMSNGQEGRYLDRQRIKFHANNIDEQLK